MSPLLFLIAVAVQGSFLSVLHAETHHQLPRRSSRSVKASVCTDDDPFLQVHNIPPLCLDFELTGAAQCEREIDVGIRFDGDNSGELVTRRPINLVGDGTCVSLSGMSLLEESIEHVCGPAVDLCLSGLRR